MKLKVNGDPMDLPEGNSVKSLLEKLSLKPERVVVELNLTILKREELAGTVLKEGDEVEIVHFVGGGSARPGKRIPACTGRSAPASGPEKPRAFARPEGECRG